MNKSTTSTGVRSVNPLYKHKNSSINKLLRERQAAKAAAEAAERAKYAELRKKVINYKGGRRWRLTKRKHPRSQ